MNPLANLTYGQLITLAHLLNLTPLALVLILGGGQ